MVRRFSLPDVTKRELSKTAGVYRFPRVSCAAASADDADLDPCIAGEFSCPGIQVLPLHVYKFCIYWLFKHKVCVFLAGFWTLEYNLALVKKNKLNWLVVGI